MFRKKISVLMVCRANICRSPLAQGTMQKALGERGLSRHIKVDSAGTHVGQPGLRPDQRSQRIAELNGFSIRRLKSRNVAMTDFSRFDYIVAMDRDNQDSLKAQCPDEYGSKLLLIMDYSGYDDIQDVPDPYFGNEQGFQRVIELIEPACHGLIDFINHQHQLN